MILALSPAFAGAPADHPERFAGQFLVIVGTDDALADLDPAEATLHRFDPALEPVRLRSDHFGALRPCWWVLVAKAFPTRGEAARYAAQLERAGVEAYVRDAGPYVGPHEAGCAARPIAYRPVQMNNPQFLPWAVQVSVIEARRALLASPELAAQREWAADTIEHEQDGQTELATETLDERLWVGDDGNVVLLDQVHSEVVIRDPENTGVDRDDRTLAQATLIRPDGTRSIRYLRTETRGWVTTGFADPDGDGWPEEQRELGPCNPRTGGCVDR